MVENAAMVRICILVGSQQLYNCVCGFGQYIVQLVTKISFPFKLTCAVQCSAVKLGTVECSTVQCSVVE